jgi:hypothetical protein
LGRAITFASPSGDYTIQLPDAPPYEDASLTVIARDGEHLWHVEVEETEGDILVLQGLARGPFLDLIDDRNAVWFELRLGEPAEIGYGDGGDSVRARVDVAKASTG